jgi:heme/copper-type cytochrome/quinol oxidase subunit 1
MAKTVVYKGGAAVGIILLILALWFAFAALQAWIVMLIIGALSSYFESIPALGFWPVFLIMWLLNIVGALFRGNSVSTSK